MWNLKQILIDVVTVGWCGGLFCRFKPTLPLTILVVCVCFSNIFIQLNETNYSNLLVIVITPKHFSLFSSVIAPTPRVNIGLNSWHKITALILSLYLHLTGTVLLQSKEGVT